jgi:hypothetical protein
LHSEESGVQKWLRPSASESRTLKWPPLASYGLQYGRIPGRMQYTFLLTAPILNKKNLELLRDFFFESILR